MSNNNNNNINNKKVKVLEKTEDKKGMRTEPLSIIPAKKKKIDRTNMN